MWLLLLLKQTIENNYLIIDKTLFIICGTYHNLHLQRKATESSSKLLLLFFCHLHTVES